MGDESVKRAFRVAYDGRAYRGFQRQPDVKTIESVIFRGLTELDVQMEDGVPLEYSAAGRTDAGVSAVAQTICFHCPDWLRPRVLNTVLPGEIRAWGWVDVQTDFHARYSAESREYTYYLYAPSSAQDLAVQQVASDLSGRHDFQRFTADNERTTRSISLSVDRVEEFLELRVGAAGFPRQLVRRVASFITEIVEEDTTPQRVEVLIDMDRDDVHRLPPAPPEPLVLSAVDYSVDFHIDAEAYESARETYADRRASLAAQTRMAGSLSSFFEVAER